MEQKSNLSSKIDFSWGCLLQNKSFPTASSPPSNDLGSNLIRNYSVDQMAMEQKSNLSLTIDFSWGRLLENKADPAINLNNNSDLEWIPIYSTKESPDALVICVKCGKSNIVRPNYTKAGIFACVGRGRCFKMEDVIPTNKNKPNGKVLQAKKSQQNIEMSSRGPIVSSPAKRTVNRGTFIGVTVTLIVILVIVITLMIVFFFLYRRTLANLQNNICPVVNN